MHFEADRARSADCAPNHMISRGLAVAMAAATVGMFVVLLLA